MKKKATPEIPDSMFGLFGIFMPAAKEERAEEYEKGSSVTGFLNSERVLTLKKESRYQKMLPKLEGLELLNLKLRNLPEDPHEKAEVLFQAVRKRIIRIFSDAAKNPEDGTVEELLNTLTKNYEGRLSITQANKADSKGAAIAAMTFREDNFYLVRYSGEKEIEGYGTVLGRRNRRAGYYHFRNDWSCEAYIMDLVDFLSFLYFFQTIHKVQNEADLPLIKDYFQEFVTKELVGRNPADDEKRAAEAVAEKAPIPLEVLLHANRTGQKEREHIYMTYRLRYVLADLLFKIYDLCQDISGEVRDRREHAKSVATAYMTKKNIPSSVQEAMKSTAFMDFFHYVEFDEDVDLESVKDIEKEFLVLNQAYFSNLRYPTVDLRFRKLGKHKATGLYYADLDTLCVDIRCPSSFIHEFCHMLDDQLGDLSLTREFEPLVKEYRRAFDEGLKNQGEQVKSQLSGSSKYNRSYFFRRAEIFARCGEIYFSRILKVDSSLVKPDLTFAYPESGLLDSLIEAYYCNLLEVRLRESDLPAAV